MEHGFEAYFSALKGVEIRRNQSMAAYSSFRIGGPANLILPASETELLACLDLARRMGFMPQVLGNATNVLVSDLGIDEPVICLRENLSDVQALGGGKYRACAGALLSSLAYESLRDGYMGLEWAAGIPGSIGGAAAMNAGAYGGEVSDVLKRVRYIEDGRIEEVQVAKEDMGYRKSPFAAPARVVVSIEAELLPDDGGARERMRDFCARRREKQPLRYPSAGSVFKRPVGHFAGALIEQAGLKGLRVGGAEVSELHAGFIINQGGASCADVLRLIEEIQSKVFRESGMELEPEIKVIGRF